MFRVYRILLILLAGISYVFVHEFGHYMVAAEYGLEPSFVYGSQSTGFLGMAIGVSHLATTASQTFFIIFGATMLPLVLVVLLAGASVLKRSEDLALMAEVYILLIAINLIPMPGTGNLDANRIWSFLLGLG